MMRRVGMLRRGLLPLAFFTLSACGGKGDSSSELPVPTAEETAAPAVAAIRLRVQLHEASPVLRRYIEQWADAEGVELDLQLSAETPPPDVEPPALLEIDAFEFRRLAADGRLREFGPAARSRLDDLLGGDAGLWSGEVFGLAWRGEVHGVALPKGAANQRLEWSSLARWCDNSGGLATPPGPAPSLLGLFLGARWTVDDPDLAEDPALLWTGEPAVEALAYVQRLARQADRLEAASIVEGLRAGRIAAASLDAEFLDAVVAAHAEDELDFVPFPTIDGSAVGVSWIRPRLLVLPRAGVHRDLAEELALVLSDLDAAHLLAETSSTWSLPMSRRLPFGTSVGGSSLRPRILALRNFARVLPAQWLSPDLQRVVAEATDAALALRRSPEDALADAEMRWRAAGADGR